MQSTHVTKSELQHWIAKNHRLIPKLEEMRSSEIFKEGHTLYALILLYRDQAIINWLTGLTYESRQELAKASETYNLLLDLFCVKNQKIRSGFLSHAFYLPITCTILGAEEAKRNEICKKSILLLSNIEDVYFTNFYMALAYLSISDTNNAASCAKSALLADTVWNRGLLELIICISVNDQNRISSAWSMALTDFHQESVSENESMPESALFLDGLALLKLNKLINGAIFTPRRDDEKAPLAYAYEATSKA